MGIDRNAARFLLSAHERGVSFESTLTLGRQDLNVSAEEVTELFQEYSLPSEPVGDGTSFLKRIGGGRVDAVDVSDYEGAAILHDLNEPIGDNLRAQYSAVFDGGTLEHVFNAPTGLRNTMEMVAEGGHLITFNPANNFLGHGFYQFSPELFFRALTPENGFDVERVVLAEEGGGWYEVTDPASVRSRVQVINDLPTYVLIQARRTRVVPVFQTWPQQSDYAAIWADYAGVRGESRGVVEHALRQRLRRVGPLWSLLRWIKGAAKAPGERRRRSFENRSHFRPVDR